MKLMEFKRFKMFGKDCIVLNMEEAAAVDAVIKATREAVDISIKMYGCGGDSGSDECSECCPEYILCDALAALKAVCDE